MSQVIQYQNSAKLQGGLTKIADGKAITNAALVRWSLYGVEGAHKGLWLHDAVTIPAPLPASWSLNQEIWSTNITHVAEGNFEVDYPTIANANALGPLPVGSYLLILESTDNTQVEGKPTANLIVVMPEILNEEDVQTVLDSIAATDDKIDIINAKLDAINVKLDDLLTTEAFTEYRSALNRHFDRIEKILTSMKELL